MIPPMPRLTFRIFLGLFVLLGNGANVSAQDSSPITGFTTLVLVPGVQILGLPISREAVWRGGIFSGNGSSVVLAGSGFDVRAVLDSTQPYYLEIESPATVEGHRIEIDVAGTLAGDGSTVVLDSASDRTTTNPSSLFWSEIHARIIPHWTLASAFGDDEYAAVLAGTTIASADQVWLLHEDTIEIYYLQQSFSGTTYEWRSLDPLVTNPGQTVLEPGTGFLMSRIDPATVELILAGEVRQNGFRNSLASGVSLHAPVFPMESSFAGSGMTSSSGFVANFSIAGADQAMLLSGSVLDLFYLKDNGGVGAWTRLGEATDYSSAELIAPESAFFISRSAPLASYLIPSPFVD